MYVRIQNENYGKAVTTYGDYVVVANPANLRYDFSSASTYHTGTVDYFRYNKNTDQHDYIGSLHRDLPDIETVLAKETGSDASYKGPLQTEDTGSVSRTRNKGILANNDAYTASAEDGFGRSIDMYEKKLVVGCPYYTHLVATDAVTITASGAIVSVFDLSRTEYTTVTTTRSLVLYSINDPDSGSIYSVPTGSFGTAVSINDQWLAIGSPLVSSSLGQVYIYRNQTTGSTYRWTLFQKINASGSTSDAQFGAALKFDKLTGSLVPRLIVGCGSQTDCKAYYFECITGSWIQTYTFIPDYSDYPMTFGNYLPYESGPFNVGTNGFGMSVSTYGDAVIVGEPYDRQFHEYSGSALYTQGSATIYERCPTETIEYLLPYYPTSSIVFGESYGFTSVVQVTASTSELHPHATININNRLYGGGWDGKIFVLMDPDGDLSLKVETDFIGGTGISDCCYLEDTGLLYFINGNSTTGNIVKVNPDNLNDQIIFKTGLEPYPALRPIVGHGHYLYTVIGNYFTKIDALTGNIVASSAWVISGSTPINTAHAGVIDSNGYYFYITSTTGYVAKVSTADLTYQTIRLWSMFPSGPSSAFITDDLAYLNGYVYATIESNGGVFKINADDMTWRGYPAAWNSFGVWTDGQHIFLLQTKEVWVYLNGDMESGPIRFILNTGAMSGLTSVNEMWSTMGGNYVFTQWAVNGKVFRVTLPWQQTIPGPTRFRQVLKTYGNADTLKNNRLGWSVDVYENNAVVGIPKENMNDLNSCYIGGTLEQLHQCSSELEPLICGQSMLIQKDTSSLEWDITNVYQKKKKYLSPYRAYGYSVSTGGRSMVVGAPILLSDSNREINITTTGSNNVLLDDVSGKAYIYNYSNLRESFHVGNVFYRNGKIILMTSGSVFDSLFFNPVNTTDYEYDLQFKGQHTIFEKQVVCTVNPGEFNVSTNPTAIVRYSASLDINGNGTVDFQDIDVILRYMQYKNTALLGVPITSDWSSSVVVNSDEQSLLRWYQDYSDTTGTETLYSSSLVQWETTRSYMQDVLDFNDDNRIDIRDMNIMWKYFANRLTQENYSSYTTPACQRKLFNDIIDYMDGLTKKTARPAILPAFLDYEREVALDKTGSYLAPMATTIGLFSGLDLVGVAKLGTPIKITPELPINFVVKMDY